MARRKAGDFTSVGKGAKQSKRGIEFGVKKSTRCTRCLRHLEPKGLRVNYTNKKNLYKATGPLDTALSKFCFNELGGGDISIYLNKYC